MYPAINIRFISKRTFRDHLFFMANKMCDQYGYKEWEVISLYTAGLVDFRLEFEVKFNK